LPTNCSEQDIRNSVKDSGADEPERINIIQSRACAYVTMPDRRSAYKIIDRLHRDIRVNGRGVKLEWATSSGIQKNDKIMDYWDKDRGYLDVPHKKLPKDLKPILEGNHLDVDTLPSNLKGKKWEF
jgi:RNA recognition motif-containing protein